MGIWELLTHPEELLALLRFQLYPNLVFKSNKDQKHLSPTLERCYELLSMTGRSFALVVQFLDNPPRDFNCLCYLLLRSLDAIEEDLIIPTEKRLTMLKSFYKIFDDPHWSYPKSNDKHGIVLREYPAISSEVRNLSTDQREKLRDVCKTTGEIMAIYTEKEIISMEDFQEYNRILTALPTKYFLQVAVEHAGENETVLEDFRLIQDAGDLFTRTNHVKDLYEDLTTIGKIQWPKVMWGKYVDNVVYLTHPKNKEKALAFLNEIVTFCLKRIPLTILFLSHLNENKTFHFFAVHTVMSIATLERLYNNYQVYSGAIKIRKGETVRLVLEAKSLDKVKAIFHHYVEKIMRRIPEEDPNATETRLACQRALEACRTKVKFETHTKLATFYSIALVVLPVTLIIGYLLLSYFSF